MDASFFATIPKFTEVPKEEAEIAWFVYDLELDAKTNFYTLTKKQTVYTEFETSLNQITKSEAGDINGFLSVLQEKLDEKLDGTPPENKTIDKVFE